MNDSYSVEDLADAIAYDSTGDKIGSINEIFLNEKTGQPNFVAVNTSMSGLVDSIVPLRGHTLRDGELHLAFERDRIEDAPLLDTTGYLTNEEQDAFYRHYGVDTAEDRTTYTTQERSDDARDDDALESETREFEGRDVDNRDTQAIDPDGEHPGDNDGIYLRRWEPNA